MKISADSGPSGNHILLCPIWFFRMPVSPKLKEMRLTLYPCMPFNSYTSYVHCNILFLTRAGHSLYLPGGFRPQYGRHIYVHPSQGSNLQPPDQTVNALTTELWRRTE